MLLGSGGERLIEAALERRGHRAVLARLIGIVLIGLGGGLGAIAVGVGLDAVQPPDPPAYPYCTVSDTC